MKPWIFLVLALILFGCSQVDMSLLEERNGVSYEKGRNYPYNGWAVAYFPAEQREKKRIYQEGSFKYGLKEGIWIVHKWNGDREEIKYRYGKRHGPTTVYNGRDRKVAEFEYQNDKLDGYSTYWDPLTGDTIKSVFYKDGVLAALPKDLTDRETGKTKSEFWGKIADEFRSETMEGR